MVAPQSPPAPGKPALCILGCGAFAEHYAEHARRLGERTDLYFASRDGAKAAAYAQRYGASGSFAGYAEAAADPRVDALIICTPHALHREHVEMAAFYRKHALVEKPIATTLADAAAMVRAAREAGIRLMAGGNFRYAPMLIEAAQVVESGEIGAVREVHVQAAIHRKQTGWRTSRSMAGGGALIDGGIHAISVMRMLAGDVARVSAAVPPRTLPGMEGEDSISAMMQFAGGAVGTLAYSWAAPRDMGRPHCLVLGERGYLKFDLYGPALEVGTEASVRTMPFAENDRALVPMLQAFLRFILLGEKPATTPEVAAGDLAVVLAAYASAEQGGEPVRVPPTTFSPQRRDGPRRSAPPWGER